MLRPASILTLAALFAAPPLHAQTLDPADIERRVEVAAPAALELYRDLLTYPNDANDADAMLRLVAWLEAQFEERGFGTERLETPGLPLLLAERNVEGAARTALVYLQADGQPVDPSAWNQASPWQPVAKERTPDGAWREIPWQRLVAERNPDWRIFARSASDSKGPVAQFLMAVSLLDEAGVAPDVNLKVIVDTQEEQGSPHLPAAVERHRDRLAADFLVIFDGPPHVSGEPTLVFGARGIATATLTTHGPRVPVHSGHYGNYVPNPAVRLARLIASMKDDAGRVTIPGWYDGVALSDEDLAVLAAVPDDEPAMMRDFGIAMTDSVAGSLQESIQYPSLNVRGLRSAWVGDDVRTIIPATATAELDIRLVPESDPERLIALLRRHVERQGYHLTDGEPTDAERLRHPRLATLTSSIAYQAFRTPFDSEPGRWATRALTRRNGEAPIRVRSFGGSIPISPFVTTLGVPAVVVPTVNPDNNQHSPNENLRLGDFLRGIGTIAAVLQERIAQPADGAPAEDKLDLDAFFRSSQPLDATFVLLDGRTGRESRYHPERAARRYRPASTFKIPNTLIALETGVVTGADFPLPWDSVASPTSRAAWRGDQTLATAFRNSVVWYYQELARRIGPERMEAWVRRLGYGNRDIGGGIDMFWLAGDLAISPDEQVEFLRRLHAGQLHVSPRSIEVLKDVMLVEETPEYRLYAKTGTSEVTATRENAWLVGIVETADRPWYFALNMEGESVGEDWPPQERVSLVRAILRHAGVLGE